MSTDVVRPNHIKKVIYAAAAFVILSVLFNFSFFYLSPGFKSHVQTVTGTEYVYSTPGYHWKGFGKHIDWKQDYSVQILKDLPEVDDGTDAGHLGSTIKSFKITFLDQVDGTVEATARFQLPISDEQFLAMAHAYRNQDNFTATALIPTIKDTIQSTAAMITADEYFSGARSEFSTNFENQLANGTYLVKRKEVRERNLKAAPQTAIAENGEDQGIFGDNDRTLYVVEKLTDAKGQYLRKVPAYQHYGVTLVEARVTDIHPNDAFVTRMLAKQTSAAALSVAKQDRLKEEETRRLAIAKGEREREETRQRALKEQAAKTTNAETDKELAIIAAKQQKEQAELQRQTAQILLEKSEIDARATRVAAEAEAYAKKAVIQADDNIALRLKTLVEINQVWAEAKAKAPVPGVVMGGGSGSGAQTNSDSAFQQAMEVIAVKSARELGLDSVGPKSTGN